VQHQAELRVASARLRRRQREQRRATAVAEPAVGFGQAGGPHGRADAERVERPQPVGPERDARPHLGDLRRALEDRDAPARAPQAQRGRQAADPAADHQRRPLHRGLPEFVAPQYGRSGRCTAARSIRHPHRPGMGHPTPPRGCGPNMGRSLVSGGSGDGGTAGHGASRRRRSVQATPSDD
jgi:hypothetical protein